MIKSEITIVHDNIWEIEVISIRWVTICVCNSYTQNTYFLQHRIKAHKQAHGIAQIIATNKRVIIVPAIKEPKVGSSTSGVTVGVINGTVNILEGVTTGTTIKRKKLC